MKSTNDEWYRALGELLAGNITKPRGLPCRELWSYQTIVNMKEPILNVPKRNLGYKFMAAEAAWILSGDNRTSTITPYSREINKFSDDGITFFGAYGPKIRDQIQYVVDCLIRDQFSRQAVINIWRERPPKTKDIPCTLSLQWIIRGNTLHCIDTMRSSDIWLGWPYDVFNMSMISRYILLYIKKVTGVHFDLGYLYLNAGSQHLYEKNVAAAKEILKDNVPNHMDWGLPLYKFDGPDQLTNWLWEAAKHGTLTSI